MYPFLICMTVLAKKRASSVARHAKRACPISLAAITRLRYTRDDVFDLPTVIMISIISAFVMRLISRPALVCMLGA
jgi:hypothetical protein